MLATHLLAHAFGQRYDLPVPLYLYLYGGAAAVVLSFLVVGYFIDYKHAPLSYAGKLIGRIPRVAKAIVAALGLLLGGIVVLTGLFGTQTTLDNFNVTFLWIMLLLGVTYLVAFTGNWWSYVDPRRIFLRILEWAVGVRLGPYCKYPKWLGYYPALLAYLGLIWLELLSYGFGVMPQHLAWLLLTYAGISVAGAVTFGPKDWFAHADFFNVFFGFVGKIAPLKYEDGKVYLRPPFVGLLDAAGPSFSLLLFVLFMLSSTAFDGLRDTRVFAHAANVLMHLPLLGSASLQITGTVLLLMLLGLFWAVYWLCMWLMSAVVRAQCSAYQLATRFVLSIVPIAVAYNMAHYFTLLLIQGQQIIKLVSDPFGWGWNLFGTANYKINVGLLNAATVWYIQVGLIVFGHIVAVYIAHRLALGLFSARKTALISQYPMLLLMVLYTMVSLWIIAQPIIKS